MVKKYRVLVESEDGILIDESFEKVFLLLSNPVENGHSVSNLDMGFTPSELIGELELRVHLQTQKALHMMGATFQAHEGPQS